MCACVAIKQMKKSMELEEKLKTMDREISVNPQYVQKVSDGLCYMRGLHETVHGENFIYTWWVKKLDYF